MHPNINEYKKVQSIAKSVLQDIKPFITAEVSEKEIAERCASLMKERGAEKTWYYECPALVLLGSRSCLSISGKDYVPSDEKVGSENLVTIDLSPLVGQTWGDCSRSFVVEAGRVWEEAEIKSAGFLQGLKAERLLHDSFIKAAAPGKTFEEIFLEMNALIKSLGFENLDFLGNVGHTIEVDKNDRLYFEKGNSAALGQDTLFTFEPHIRKAGGRWGFKLENIYYFDGGGAREL